MKNALNQTITGPLHTHSQFSIYLTDLHQVKLMPGDVQITGVIDKYLSYIWTE